MKPLPIRWKFAAWTSSLTTFILVIYSAFTLINFYDEQIEAVDLELKADGQRLMGLPTLREVEAAAQSDEKYAPWMAHALYDELGTLRFRSDKFSEGLARTALVESLPHTVRGPDRTWRTATYTAGGLSLIVAYDLAETWDMMEDLVMAYSISLPVAVLLAALCVWWVAGRVLRPLGDLTTSVERVQAERLDQRVPVPRAADELQRLSTVFNAMLARLEKSFEQAQRFAADASHELRTPLTIIRGEIDQLTRAPGITADHQVKLVSVQEEIVSLHHITENLLLLARFDSGSLKLPMGPVDFSALVSEACEDADLLATPQGVRLEAEISSQLSLRGEGHLLRRAVLNLLDNAVKYNRPDGVVRCSLRPTSEGIVLDISNTGSGIAEQFRSRIFQRFFRADPSRSKSQGGHGLGLSLSREIARAHGGDLRYVESADPTWTVFRMTLPTGGRSQAQ